MQTRLVHFELMTYQSNNTQIRILNSLNKNILQYFLLTSIKMISTLNSKFEWTDKYMQYCSILAESLQSTSENLKCYEKHIVVHFIAYVIKGKQQQRPKMQKKVKNCRKEYILFYSYCIRCPTYFLFVLPYPNFFIALVF